MPITDKIICRHLEGRNGYSRDAVGLYPLLQDETTYIKAIDFDDEDCPDDSSLSYSSRVQSVK